MTDTEKAKAYDEAVAYAKRVLDGLAEDYRCTHMTKDDIINQYSRLFPNEEAFQDDEDSFACRKLIYGLKSLIQQGKETFAGADITDLIDYLEKKQKPFKEPIDGVLYAAACGIKNKEQVEKSEKPSEGTVDVEDVAAEKAREYALSLPGGERTTAVGSTYSESGYYHGFVDGSDWQKEQKPAEWSEEDKQWLSEVYSAIDHSMYSEVERQAMKKYIDHLRYQSQPKQELDEESNKVVLKAVELLNSYGNSLYNGSFEKESNAVYKVADSLKLLSTQPKPEWSENERQRLKTIAGYLRYKGYEEDAYFIESIPPQQKEEGIKGVKGHPDPAGVWKPSDGQLKALKYFLGQHRLQMDASTTQWEEYDDLRSLYDILCKIAKS